MHSLRSEDDSHSSYNLYEHKLEAIGHNEARDEYGADIHKEDGTQIEKRLENEHHHSYGDNIDIIGKIARDESDEKNHREHIEQDNAQFEIAFVYLLFVYF